MAVLYILIAAAFLGYAIFCFYKAWEITMNKRANKQNMRDNKAPDKNRKDDL